MGYTWITARGVSWITLLRASTRIITLLKLSVLGRILTPSQFGFFGIASLILSLLETITETGINVFLVQEKKDIKNYINSAWTISIVRGIILSALVFLFASLISSFFNTKGAYEVITLMSIVPFIRGFINPGIITYQKELIFRKEFQFRFVLFLIDVVVAIAFALATRSATSFVYGLIASAILEVILSFILIPLRPKLHFEYEKAKRIIQKGWWVTLTGIFLHFADNGDNIAVGKILGSSSLGIYQVAYKFSTLPISEITNVVNQVVFPIYAKFSENKRRLGKAFVKVTVLSSFGSILLGGVIFVFAKPIILAFMGEQWVPTIPVIQVLAAYGILRTIFGNFPPLFLSVARQDYVAQMTFFRLIGLTILVVPLVVRFGMLGAGYAMLCSMLVEIPVILYFAYNVFKKGTKSY